MRSRLASCSMLIAGLTLAGCSFQGGVTVDAPAATTTIPAPTTPPPDPPSTPPTSGPAPTGSGPTSPVDGTGGGSPTSSTGSSGPSSEPTAPVTACRTEDLAAALAPAPAPGTTADTAESATITLTNLGQNACRLRGFGGIALSRSDGRPVLATQQRTDATTTSVLLPRGGVARSTISRSRTADAAVGEPATGDCEPVPTSLSIIPPDEVAELAVPWSFGPVCNQGTITQSPYTAA